MKQQPQLDHASVAVDEPAQSVPTPDGSTWVNPRLAGRIPELDGVRGLAILLVLIFHYAVLLVISHLRVQWQITPFVLFRLAWSGVDLFFVLSGFLIGGILLDAKYADGYYRTFYLRRLHRILPIYFVLIAAFVVGVYSAGPRATGALGSLFNRTLPLWSYPLFVQNFVMAAHNDFGTGWMGATWSLAVEEQFYLLLPFIIRRLSPRGTVRFAVGMVLLAPALRFVLAHHGATEIARYALLPCRGDALGCGLLLAIACRNRAAWTWLAAHRRYFYGAFIVLANGIIVWSLCDLQLGYSWMAAFYLSLMVLVVVAPGRLERVVFRNPVFVKLGTVAYAVYLLHSGILGLYHYLFFRDYPTISGWPTLGVTALSLGTVLLLSAISWRVLEKPLIRRAHSTYRYLKSQPATAPSAP